ncbi:glycine C-acetyltransferase [bacterium]|nr:glycine C-acetyltransferase [bacterium]MBU1637224.1 glycine C-acetyltransferase [bacterium]
MYGQLKNFLIQELNSVREAGLYKTERIIQSPQGAEIKVPQGEVLNFCANNYLGLGDHPDLIAAAKDALDRWGYGMSSVRFICGTQDIHRQLEKKIAEFLGMEDAILYSSCFDANGGLFETLMKEEDAIITDALNHASIIDGVRLSKAKRAIYKHADMADLEARLKELRDARFRLVVTDGVFSMDGDIAKLPEICDLCEKHDAILMVDDSHSTGFMGKQGRGTHEFCDVMGRVDIITSTLGKALGGASGGFTSARQEIVDILRQRSRPYLFSNTLPPPIAASALQVITLLSETTALRDKLESNTIYFREKMTEAGFDIRPGTHPIVPIMLYDAKVSQVMADKLLKEGIYVIGFFFPVVPKGQARIRVQISAAHSRDHLDRAIEAFTKVGKEMGVIK